jgi:hypothetical protein
LGVTETDGFKKGEEKGSDAAFFGRGRDYWIARLERANEDDLALKGKTKEHFAELAAKVRSGEVSANAAAIEAGFRRKLSGLTRLLRAWAAANDEERDAFRDKISKETD